LTGRLFYAFSLQRIEYRITALHGESAGNRYTRIDEIVPKNIIEKNGLGKK